MKRLFIVMAAIMLSLSAMAEMTYFVTNRATSLELNKKYIIYDSAMPTSGTTTQDRTGVIYDGRASNGKVSHLKCKLITNRENRPFFTEKHLITLEAGSAEGTYAFKTAYGYILANGDLSTEKGDIKIQNWENATGKSGSNSLLVDGTTAAPDNATTFVISNVALSSFWNGNTNSFATWTDAHPYVFYEVEEAGDVDPYAIQFLDGNAYFTTAKITEIIQELQDDYGFVREATQFSSNAKANNEGSYEALLDGNLNSFFHSNWYDWHYTAGYDRTIPHYLQADVSVFQPRSFRIITAARTGTTTITNRPRHVKISISDDGEVWKEISDTTFTLSDKELYLFTEPYSTLEDPDFICNHIRYTVYSTNVNGDNLHYFSFGEYYIVYETEDTKSLIDNFRIAKAELEQYQQGTSSNQLSQSLLALSDVVTKMRNNYTAIDEIEADEAPAVERPEITVDLMGRKITNIEGRRTIKKGNVTIVL